MAQLPGHTDISIVGIESGERRGAAERSVYIYKYDDQHANVGVSSSVFFNEVSKLTRP